MHKYWRWANTKHYSFTSDGLTTPDAAVNNFTSVKLVTPLVTSVTPLLVMTFSFGTAAGDIKLFISNTMLRAAHSPPLPPTKENIRIWTLRKL